MTTAQLAQSTDRKAIETLATVNAAMRSAGRPTRTNPGPTVCTKSCTCCQGGKR